MHRDPRHYRTCIVVCGLLASGAVGAQAIGSPNQGVGLSNPLTDTSGAPIAHGLQLAYGLDAGVGETDNVNLTPPTSTFNTAKTENS